MRKHFNKQGPGLLSTGWSLYDVANEEVVGRPAPRCPVNTQIRMPTKETPLNIKVSPDTLVDSLGLAVCFSEKACHSLMRERAGLFIYHSTSDTIS